MKTSLLGIIILIVGIVMILFTGFRYVTSKNVVDLGPIQINKENEHFVQWPPILGGILIGVGILILLIDKKRSSS